MARTKRTPKKEAKFLEVLAETGNVSHACKLSMLPRQSPYDLRKLYSDFEEAWDKTCEIGADALIDEATRRAVDGVEQPVFRKGEVVGYTTKYSDTLLIFLLKARRPGMFKDHPALPHVSHQTATDISDNKRE